MAANHNLDTLQSMLSLLFIQSGRFLKEHQAGGGTGRMRLGMQRAVPVAAERFHDALDELEKEIRLAQTVLRRDLALLKDARKKRATVTKQHEADRARLATEARNPPAQTIDLAVQASQPKKRNNTATPAATHAAIEHKPDPAAKAENREPAAKAENREPAPKSEPEHVSPPSKTSTDPPAHPPLITPSNPATANPQETEFDFDAMFGDAMDTTDENGMDTSTNLELTLDEANNAPSLLQGLEDFAKDCDDDDIKNNKNNSQSHAQSNNTNTSSIPAPDTSMDMDLDVPDTDSKPSQTRAPLLTNPDPAPTPAVPGPPQTVPLSQPPLATTLVKNKKTSNKAATATAAAAAATTITTTQEDLMATMATDNLEDLFNMDDYENPENSSFDDAFFSFNS